MTLIEADDFVGGKLGAHRDIGGPTKPTGEPCTVCEQQGGVLRRDDWHEHCYHMYLNWYHNFWEMMDEIGTLEQLRTQAGIYSVPRGDYDVRTGKRGAPPPNAIRLVNVGSPGHSCSNLFAGIGTPADQFLWGQTMADLIGEPARRGDWLEKSSITGFLKSRVYTTDAALAGTYRTTAQAFASPSYLSSARSFKALLSYGLRLPEPSMWMLIREHAGRDLHALAEASRCACRETFDVQCPKGIELGKAFQAAIAARRPGIRGLAAISPSGC